MLGGLFLASKAQNLAIDTSVNNQRFITGGYLRFTGGAVGGRSADINVSKSTFNLGEPGSLVPLPYFAIHEIYGVASGGGGGGSHGFYLNEYGEGGKAGKQYSVLVKLFSPEMSKQWCITNLGGTAGVSGDSIAASTAGGNGRTEFNRAFLFSVKTAPVGGVGGRKWGGGGTQYNSNGEQSSSPPYGKGGNGGKRNSSAAEQGYEGSTLCRGLVW